MQPAFLRPPWPRAREQRSGLTARHPPVLPLSRCCCRSLEAGLITEDKEHIEYQVLVSKYEDYLVESGGKGKN